VDNIEVINLSHKLEKTKMTSNKYSPGHHPNSQANLNYRGGRPKVFDSEKKRRNISVTEEGWEGLQPIVEELGCKSVSDLLEKLGRGVVKLSA
jgi:hypothetical protein